MTIPDILGRSIFAFLFIRKAILERRATPENFQVLVSELVPAIEKSFRAPHYLVANGLVLHSRGWLGLLPTRKIIVERSRQGEISISNYPNAMAQGFGVFFVAFVVLYELVAIAKLFGCYFQGSCQSAVVMALIILAPIPIYFMALLVYGLQYLASLSLYRFVIDRCEKIQRP